MLLSTPINAQEDILVALTVMDIVTTNFIAVTGGVELNPLLPANDLGKLILIKSIILVVYLKTSPSKWQVWVMNIVVSTAVVNNLWQIENRK